MSLSRVDVLASVFGKKPGEEFRFKGCSRRYRVTESGLQYWSERLKEWLPEIIGKWTLYAETEKEGK